ncbi:MAG: homocysteine biosynthesis protein [Actinomycetota bacterium]|nr:homocysteine biosynthesis protein [Actinomycetota bacterium]
MSKTFDEINQKIREGRAVVVTAEEIIDVAREKGAKEAAKMVDVVTTATFGPMCSSGAFINFGHSDPPIKMRKVWLNNVPAYTGIAAVDAYLGATEMSEDRGLDYGGGHVIEDLIAGKQVKLKAIGFPTDCYPLDEIETCITLNDVNQAYLYNSRNAYQNYFVATNSSDRTIYTYMGTLLPKLANATYCSAGQLSPLLKDPYLRTIGIGTKIFLGGAQGFVSFEGTQFNTEKERTENGVPTTAAACLALSGDLKDMTTRYIKAASIHNYGISLFVGVGIPIPVLDEDMIEHLSLSDEEICVDIYDYGVARRSRPNLGRVNYKELKSGKIKIGGKIASTAPLSSYARAKEIAEVLKGWIQKGDFELSAPVASLPKHKKPTTLEVRSKVGGSCD